VACLRGEAIHRVQLNGAKLIKHEFLFKNQYGRIRDVVAGPDGYIYFSTSQRDPPEGKPRPGDDRIFRLVPAGTQRKEQTTSETRADLASTESQYINPESQHIKSQHINREEQTFQQLCANCHGKNLQGGDLAGSLVDGVWKFGGESKAIFSSIKKGHPEAGMPAWEGALTDEQIQSLVNYIRRQKK
jgi:mono/diheme cytochrome c family protein